MKKRVKTCLSTSWKRPLFAIFAWMRRNTTKKFILLLSCSLFFSCLLSAQLDKSFLFLNYKKSTRSNFINSEFQIGNSDERHFLTLLLGYNFSNYQSDKYVPYLTYNTTTEIFYDYKSYKSKKKGFQAGLGYNYYFLNSENKKEIIPYFGLELYWLHNRDNFSLSYENIMDGSTKNIDHVESFNTLSCDMQVGILYALNKIYFRASVSLGFYLPINNNIYMPTDGYNPYSGFKLPLAGLEPALQLSVGLKLF